MLTSPAGAYMAHAAGYGEASQAATSRLVSVAQGIWEFATEDGRARKILDHVNGRLSYANELDALGDGNSIFRAAIERGALTTDVATLLTGGGGVAKGGAIALTRAGARAADFAGDVAYASRVSDPGVANTLPELRPKVRNTFSNVDAVVSVLNEPLLVQRFHGGGSSTKGAFTTTDIFKSRVDVREQLAMPYTWSDGTAGNAVTKVTTIELPVGTRIWSGRAAPQIDGVSGKVYQGGGNQTWIDATIQDNWIRDTRWFRSDRGKN